MFVSRNPAFVSILTIDHAHSSSNARWWRALLRTTGPMMPAVEWAKGLLILTLAVLVLVALAVVDVAVFLAGSSVGVDQNRPA